MQWDFVLLKRRVSTEELCAAGGYLCRRWWPPISRSRSCRSRRIVPVVVVLSCVLYVGWLCVVGQRMLFAIILIIIIRIGGGGGE